MAKKALLILAEGFEDIEAVTAIDILRRADVEVTVAGLSPGPIRGARGTAIQPDAPLDKVQSAEYDALVLPGGGKGAENLAASGAVKDLILRHHKQQRVVGAICAAPAVVLAPTGILNGRSATCFPGMEGRFPKTVISKTDPVVSDGHIITSRGPGTAMAFSLALVRKLCGPEVAEKIRRAVLA